MDHPNIVKLHALATNGTSSFSDGNNDGYFLILDYVDDTLSHRIEQWRIEQQEQEQQEQQNHQTLLSHYAEKIQYASQIANALEYLHQHDIMYRDLKPDNIGIQNDGTIKLFDFGLCRELPEATSAVSGNTTNTNHDKVFTMSGCGTRRYMAPEVACNLPYNVKIDVYSFSIVLYEMISLQKPYELYNKELHQFLVCENGQRPNLNVNWPKQLQDLLRNTWCQIPSNRLSMTQVCIILQRMTGGGGGVHNSSMHNNMQRTCPTSCTTATDNTKMMNKDNTTAASTAPLSFLGLFNTPNTILNFVGKFKTSVGDSTSSTNSLSNSDDISS